MVFDGDERAQNGAHRLRGNVAVCGGVFLGVFAYVSEHGAQVFEVNKQHLLVVGNAEDNIEHAFLYLRKAEQPRKQHESHV